MCTYAFVGQIYFKMHICIICVYSNGVQIPIFITGFILPFCLLNVCLHEYLLGGQSKKMVALEKGNRLLCSWKEKE